MLPLIFLKLLALHRYLYATKKWDRLKTTPPKQNNLL